MDIRSAAGRGERSVPFPIVICLLRRMETSGREAVACRSRATIRNKSSSIENRSGLAAMAVIRFIGSSLMRFLIER